MPTLARYSDQDQNQSPLAHPCLQPSKTSSPRFTGGGRTARLDERRPARRPSAPGKPAHSENPCFRWWAVAVGPPPATGAPRSARRCTCPRPGKGRLELISRWARHPALPGPDTLHTHGRAWNRPSPTAVAMVTLAQAQNRARWPCTALLGRRPLRDDKSSHCRQMGCWSDSSSPPAPRNLIL